MYQVRQPDSGAAIVSLTSHAFASLIVEKKLEKLFLMFDVETFKIMGVFYFS